MGSDEGNAAAVIEEEGEGDENDEEEDTDEDEEREIESFGLRLMEGVLAASAFFRI